MRSAAKTSLLPVPVACVMLGPTRQSHMKLVPSVQKQAEDTINKSCANQVMRPTPNTHREINLNISAARTD